MTVVSFVPSTTPGALSPYPGRPRKRGMIKVPRELRCHRRRDHQASAYRHKFCWKNSATYEGDRDLVWRDCLIVNGGAPTSGPSVMRRPRSRRPILLASLNHFQIFALASRVYLRELPERHREEEFENRQTPAQPIFRAHAVQSWWSRPPGVRVSPRTGCVLRGELDEHGCRGQLDGFDQLLLRQQRRRMRRWRNCVHGRVGLRYIDRVRAPRLCQWLLYCA